MELVPYFYRVNSVDYIVDGDTIDMTLDLGFCISKKDRFRLMRFDAPETFRPTTEAERAGGYRVKEEITRIVTTYRGRLKARTSKSPDIYGRYDVEMYYEELGGSLVSINDVLIKFIADNNITKEYLRTVVDSK